VVLGFNPVTPKLGLLAESCNTASGGQDYLDVDGGPIRVSLLEGWFFSRTKANGEKEAPFMKLVPAVGPGCRIAYVENVFWYGLIHDDVGLSPQDLG
jgi:hypothetical protein